MAQVKRKGGYVQDCIEQLEHDTYARHQAYDCLLQLYVASVKYRGMCMARIISAFLHTGGNVVYFTAIYGTFLVTAA